MYGSVAEWITYAAARGDTVVDNAGATAALVRASDYIQFFYVERFSSAYDATDADIAAVIEKATYEAAKLELATPGFFTKSYTPAQAKVLTKVDTIEWTVSGAESGPDSVTPVSSKIDAMLARYLGTRGARPTALVV